MYLSNVSFMYQVLFMILYSGHCGTNSRTAYFIVCLKFPQKNQLRLTYYCIFANAKQNAWAFNCFMRACLNLADFRSSNSETLLKLGVVICPTFFIYRFLYIKDSYTYKILWYIHYLKKYGIRTLQNDP